MVIRGNIPQQYLSRSRGVVSVRYMADGRIVCQKWPRRRRGPLPMVTQMQVAKWDMVQEWVKRPAPKEYALALTATKGTAFYARDILIMCAYGHYIGWPGWGVQPDDLNPVG